MKLLNICRNCFGDLLLQGNDEFLWRTGDHGPATWIHSIFIPIKNRMRVFQSSFDGHQGLH